MLTQEQIAAKRAQHLASVEQYKKRMEKGAEKFGVTTEEFKSMRLARASATVVMHVLQGNPYRREMVNSFPLSDGYSLSGRALSVAPLAEDLKERGKQNDFHSVSMLMYVLAQYQNKEEKPRRSVIEELVPELANPELHQAHMTRVFNNQYARTTGNLLRRKLMCDLVRKAAP